MAKKEVTIAVGFEVTGEDELRSAANQFGRGLAPGLAAIERFNGQINASFKDFERQANESAKGVQRAFAVLGVGSVDRLQTQLKALAAAYKTLRDSGQVSTQDLANAHANLVTKSRALVAAYKEQGQAGKAASVGITAGMGEGSRLIEGMRSRVRELIVSLLAVYSAHEAWSKFTEILREGQVATQKFTSSLEAAKREFAGVGTLTEWDDAIKDLSREMRVFSETDIKNASARLVDMTKRFGLTGEQMRVLLARTAELSAGKLELSEGIERVTSAIRGEAEASEYLGLTLNDTYVANWIKAHNAQEKAYSSLTENEKAQYRYKIILEQTSAVQGRAAASATTVAGAWQMVKARVSDAIVNNEDMARVMSDLAKYLASNADKIGSFASSLTSAVAAVATFIGKHRELLAALVETGAPIVVLYKLTSAIMLLNKGMGAFSTLKLAAEAMQTATAFKEVGTAVKAIDASKNLNLTSGSIEALTGKVKALSIAMKMLPAAMVAAAGVALIHMIDNRKSAIDAETASMRLQMDMRNKEQESLARYNRLLGMSFQSHEALQDALQRYPALSEVYQAAVIREAAALKRSRFEEIAAAQASIAAAEQKKNAGITAAQAQGQKSMEVLRAVAAEEQTRASASIMLYNKVAFEKIKAEQTWLDSLKDKLKLAEQEYKSNTEKIKALRDQIARNNSDIDDEERDISRKGWSEAKQWYDKKLQAEELLLRAQEERAKKNEGSEARANELADKAKQIFRSLADSEIREGEKVVISMDRAKAAAIKGLEEIRKFKNEIPEATAKLLEEKNVDYEKFIEDTKKKIDAAKAYIESQRASLQVEMTLAGYEEAKKLIDSIPKEIPLIVREKFIPDPRRQAASKNTDWSNDSEGSASNAAGHATGGLIPGHGGGDIVPAWLEPGEYVMSKDAVDALGPGFLDGLNTGRFNAFAGLREALARMQGMKRTPSWMQGITSTTSRAIANFKALDTNAAQKFSSGGIVQSIAAASPGSQGGDAVKVTHYGSFDIGVQGETFKALFPKDVADALKKALTQEKLLRPQGGKK